MTPTWYQSYTTEGEVSLTYVDLSHNPQHEFSALQLLNYEERQRAARFQSRAARRNFVLCRSALRMNLCDMLQCANDDLSFTSIRNEKPCALLSGQEVPFNFNVSHTRGHGLLAFAKMGRVGVDIEQWHVRHDIDGEIRKVFSNYEQRKLKVESKEKKTETFLRLWTLKEAVIKAVGEGFRADTTAFTIPDRLIDGGNRAVAQFESISGAEWELAIFKDNKFLAALAHELT